jgi:hypothetical protein
MGIYDKTNSAVERLEYLRGELMSERISTGELLELQGLVEHVSPGDVELLEAAGVPEFPAQDTEGIYTTEEQAVIEGLRNKGYCVIIWTPEEMTRCTESPRRLEEAVIFHARDCFFRDEEEAGDDICDICGRSGVTCSRVTEDGRTMGNECGCSEEGDEN